MWKTKDPRTEPAQCPVCRTLLGKRDCSTVYTAHCQECKATFYWKPWSKSPSVILDKDQPITCGCGCGR